ncbi:MAG: MFS transporter [Planctomycetota bacterium]|jgi:MFS family permease
MSLPNPLASRWGRLMAFFFLYVTEGIPLGFTATAMVIQLQNAGVRPLEIGVFVGSLYFPWAWKWVVGPFVDLIYSNRLGARRGWIIGTQFSMVATLLICMPFEVSAENLQLLTAVILIHNMFCATQDVAIDALACTVLHEDEQGLGNGLMFAGQKIGFAMGGACVLFLTEGFDIPWLPELLQKGLPFQLTYPYIVGCILSVTFFVAWPMREERREHPPANEEYLKSFREKLLARRSFQADEGTLPGVSHLITLGGRCGSTLVRSLLPRNLSSNLSQVQLRLAEYVDTAGRSVFGSRVAFVALLLALLPPGAMALDLALQKQVAKEIGFTDGDVGRIDLVSSIVWAVACVAGGYVSDRLGHLKCLAVFFLLISIPTFWCAWKMDEAGMNLPKLAEVTASEANEAESPVDSEQEPDAADGEESEVAEEPVKEQDDKDQKEPGIFERPDSPPMASYFWWAVMAYMVCQGLMYGTRTAIFMRIANPEVAATQFTAYMSMMNLVTSYTAVWQGYTIERLGFAQTLYIDGFVGLICIGLLPFLRQRDRAAGDENFTDVFQDNAESDA